ncbi:MAG: hypothetical protein QXH80_00900 [Candidatus Nanoarchaeia archaeon]
MMAFFIAATFAIFIFVHLFPQFAIFNPLLLLAIIAGMAGAIIETIPTVNDNTTIPLGTALVIWLLALLL